MKKICVTGANGFIGKSLCKKLILSKYHVTGLTRFTNLKEDIYGMKQIQIGDLVLKPDLKNILKGQECIIHCAGKAHLMHEKKEDTALYYSINTEATKFIAEQAVKAGVKRFIFLSSIKVNGENTDGISNKIFQNNDIPDPKDDYAKSKLEAEKKLKEISSKTSLEVVIIRLPLVYGYGVKGNFLRLINLINIGFPLPFSLINSQKSLIGIDNLIDLITKCIDHPEAKSKTFLVSDDEDVSVPKLLRYIASAMERPLLLFPVPIFFLKLFGSIIGKKNEIRRFLESLRVDIEYTKKILGWKAPISLKEGISRMVKKQ